MFWLPDHLLRQKSSCGWISLPTPAPNSVPLSVTATHLFLQVHLIAPVHHCSLQLSHDLRHHLLPVVLCCHGDPGGFREATWDNVHCLHILDRGRARKSRCQNQTGSTTLVTRFGRWAWHDSDMFSADEHWYLSIWYIPVGNWLRVLNSIMNLIVAQWPRFVIMFNISTLGGNGLRFFESTIYVEWSRITIIIITIIIIDYIEIVYVVSGILLWALKHSQCLPTQLCQWWMSSWEIVKTIKHALCASVTK